MALYGKYRPQNFANLVGQDSIRQTLLHEIQKSMVAHAYLFAGPRGTGKTSTARLIAKALNCEKKSDEGEPCDECDFCKTISDGSLIDVIEIDAASNRGIDEIRDLKEKIKFAPTRAKTKTYIIDEVHMLTKEAFNALLKTLEEPPENVFFILCTTEIHKIPETIISRCQRFDFKRIDIKTIMTRLNYIAQLEGLQVEDSAIEMIARHVDGGMRDAIGLLDQLRIDKKLSAERVRNHLGITGHETVELLIDFVEKKDMLKAVNLINQVHNEGLDLNSFAREILECLRERLIGGIQNGLPGCNVWLGMINNFEEARDMMRSAVIPQLPLEMAVIKICGGDGVIRDEEDNGKVDAQKVTEGAKIADGRKTEDAQKTVADRETADVKKVAANVKKNLRSKTDEKLWQADEKSQQAEEKTAETLKTEYEMEPYREGGAQKHWPRILEQIQPPALRRSLSDCKPSESESGELLLTFGSRFHMDKVNLAENKTKIEKAANRILGKTLKVICMLDSSRQKTTDVGGNGGGSNDDGGISGNSGTDSRGASAQPKAQAQTRSQTQSEDAQKTTKTKATHAPNITEKALEIFGDM